MPDAKAILTHLKTWPAFSGLGEEALKALSHELKAVELLEDTELVTQGQQNTRLYIVYSGLFKVIVDGLNINSLESPGETFGEISWITQQPASATVVGKAGSVTLQISFERLNEISNSQNGEISVHLMQVLPKLIIQRLVQTNDKAKQVEAMFERLRATEESLKLVNETLEYQLARREKETLELINQISDKSIPKLISYIQNSRSNASNQLSEEPTRLFDELEGQLGRINDTLSKLGESSKPHSHPIGKIVGLELDTKAKSALATVTQALGLNPAEDTDAKESPIILVSGNPDQNFNTSEVPAYKKSILFIRDLNLSELPNLKNFDNFVHCQSENKSALIRALTIALNKVLFDNLWGVHKYLSWGSKIQSLKIRDSKKRLENIETVTATLKQTGIRSSQLSRIHLVLEELLMNAIYDAPTDIKGNPLFNHVTRQQAVTLPEGDHVEIQFGTDGLIAGVSVIDPYGSLTKEAMATYLQSASQGLETHSPKKGGAGKGLFMIVSNSDLTVFNVDPGQRTEVVCLFELDKKQQEDLPAMPSFHFYFRK